MSAATGPYRGKRLVDLALLALLALPALLLAIPCALAVACTSRGPVFFRQPRVGRDGRDFVVWKFRTMRHDPAATAGLPDEARITRVGRLLRRLSLDELPNLLNVARGDMSIVGPRPTLRYQVDRYDERQRRRLLVRPGLTGLAQIRGRNLLEWEERIEHDLEYVERQSIGLDLGIVVRTVPVFVAGRGVEGHPADDALAVRDDPA